MQLCTRYWQKWLKPNRSVLMSNDKIEIDRISRGQCIGAFFVFIPWVCLLLLYTITTSWLGFFHFVQGLCMSIVPMLIGTFLGEMFYVEKGFNTFWTIVCLIVSFSLIIGALIAWYLWMPFWVGTGIVVCFMLYGE